MADGADVFHDDLQRAPFAVADRTGRLEVLPRALVVEAVPGKKRRARLAGKDVVAADPFRAIHLVGPGAHGDLAHIRDQAHFVHLAVEGIAAPVVDEAEPGADAAGIVDLELLEHGRGHRGEHLRKPEHPDILCARLLGIVTGRGQLVRPGARAMDEALRLAEQPLLLQLVEHGQVPVGHAAHEAMHEIGPIHQGIQCPFDAHPHADGIPQGEIGVQPPRPHRKHTVEKLMRDRETARGLRRVVTDPWHPYLLDVGIRLELVVKTVTDNVVVGIRHRDLLVGLDAEARVVHRAGDAQERLDHHVHGEMPPLEQGATETFFIPSALRIRASEGELVIDRHLVPAHLVDHDHGARGVAGIEPAPQAARLLLCRPRGDIRRFRGQRAKYLLVPSSHANNSPCLPRSLSCTAAMTLSSCAASFTKSTRSAGTISTGARSKPAIHSS